MGRQILGNAATDDNATDQASFPTSLSVARRAALPALLLLALALRLPGLGRASLWWDECATLETALAVSRLSLTAMAGALMRGLSAYFLILAPWVRSDSSELALRLPSVLAAIALVPVAWRLGEILGGWRLAWRLGLAVAVAPFFVWHAREARWYALTWLLAGIGLVHFARALEGRSRKDVLGCLAWGFAATLTYAPAIVSIVVQGVWLGVQGAMRPGDGRSRVRGHPITIATVLLVLILGGTWFLFALVVPALHGGASGYGFKNLGGPRPEAVAYTGVAFTTGYTIGPGPAEWHHRPPAWPSPSEAAALLAAAMAMTLLIVTGWRRLREAGHGSSASALAVVATLTILATTLASLWTGHRYAPRHAGLAGLPFLALAAAGTLPGRRWSKAGPLLASALLVIQAVSLWNLHQSPRYARESVRPAAADVAAEASTEDLVLVFGGIDLPWRHYYAGAARWQAVHANDAARWTPEAIARLLAPSPRVFIVRGLILGEPAEIPILAAVEGATRIEKTCHYDGIEVTKRSVVR